MMYYNQVMKNIILLLIVLVISSGICIADENKEANKAAMDSMVASHRYFHEVCANAANNFRVDNQFSGYIKGKCILYESDRQRLLTSVFPISNATEKSYREQYPILMSKFAIEMNNKEIESLKFVINEYCKYNKYKYVKRAPQACTQETINSLFEI